MLKFVLWQGYGLFTFYVCHFLSMSRTDVRHLTKSYNPGKPRAASGCPHSSRSTHSLHNRKQSTHFVGNPDAAYYFLVSLVT